MVVFDLSTGEIIAITVVIIILYLLWMFREPLQDLLSKEGRV